MILGTIYQDTTSLQQYHSLSNHSNTKSHLTISFIEKIKKLISLSTKMSYIHTSSMPIDYIGKNTVIKCPPYSKLLHVHIKQNFLYATYKTEQYVTNYPEHNWKSFEFIVIRNLVVANQPIQKEYEYVDTIRSLEDDMVSYYHVFVNEVKSIEEQRDSKIETLMDQDF